MKCYFLYFVTGGLAPHVIAWVEAVVVIILISFLLKKGFTASYFPASLGWRERWVGRSLHLYCLVPLTLD